MEGKVNILIYIQTDQSRFKIVFEEYPFLLLRPLNIFTQHFDLNSLTVGNRVEAVE